jgi:hypothetical protein
VLESGAVRTLERDRRAGADGSLERPGGGDRGNGERSCDHETDENGTACHLVQLRPGAANGFIPA